MSAAASRLAHPPSVLAAAMLAACALAPALRGQAPVAKLNADNTSLIGVGEAVALDGDTALSFGTLPDHEGRAVVFVRRLGGWEFITQLPFVPVAWAASGLKYGSNLDLVADTAFVGATGDPGVGSDMGIVHVYQRDDRGTPAPFDDLWLEIEQLIGGDSGAMFGFAVAAEGELVVAGGPGITLNRGWARLFLRDDAGTPADPFDDEWSDFVDLDPPSPPAPSLFGFDVALSGDLVAVSDPFGAGRVDTWLRVADDDWVLNGSVLPKSPEASEFGWSIALEGETLLVGHRGDGLQGSASFFRFDDGGTPGDPADDQWLPDGTHAFSWMWSDFGFDVALDGDRALVSAVILSFPFQAGGRVVEFQRSAGLWSQSAVHAATGEHLGDGFGWSLDLAGGEVLVGTHGDKDVDAGSGAVWVLDLDSPDPWVDEGFGLPGPELIPRLVGWGLPVDNHDMAIKLLDAHLGDAAWLVLGTSLTLLPFKGGSLVPAPELLAGPLSPDSAGRLLLEWEWPRDVPAGAQLVLQFWLSQASPPGWSASNGLSITMP